MRGPFFKCLAFLVLISVCPETAAFAEDLRVMSIQEQKARSELLRKVTAEKQKAEEEAREDRRRILTDRERLKSATAQLQAEIKRLTAAVETGAKKLADSKAEGEKLSTAIDERQAITNELIGHVRILAKDLDALVTGSFGQVLHPERRDVPAALASQSQFPGMPDLRQMVIVLEDEIRSAGEVRLVRGPLVDRSGKTIAADLLFLGHFTAAYRQAGTCEYLYYLPGSQKLFAPQKPSPGKLRKSLRQYLTGQSDTVPLDITRGGALRQLGHRTSLLEHIARGGPIVWPILIVFALGAMIIIERVVFLWRKRIDADSLMNRINKFAGCEDWDACQTLCGQFEGKPVSRVLQAGLDCRLMERTEMENVLQEAILQEIPGLERFLSTLGMLAAIAPLLGLLGTVTGMINTFDMITHYGTGNPRMMSGGISEALITTMLGLSVAIPILLCHTLLSRRTENIIAQMEEKAVAFTNVVYKTRKNSGN
jgi:biopolymer transport protein ExbB